MTDTKAVIKKTLDRLNYIEDEYGRFNLYFWVLSNNYATSGELQKCMDILNKGMDEGLYFPFRMDIYTFPAYLNDLKKMEGFDDLFARN